MRIWIFKCFSIKGTIFRMESLRQQAHALGFQAFGMTQPQAISGLSPWLEAGFHGDMAWMESRADERANPQILWPEVQSIIMLGANYAPQDNPLHRLNAVEMGNISVYALNQDYHDILKKHLKTLARALIAQKGGDVKVFIDTAPVQEKPLAALAGLGWQGKHSNLVSREFGSYLFLGAIFTTLALTPSQAESNHCGSCTACLDICPTKAFPSPYVVNANRCISYLTIEYKGVIADEFRIPMGNRIYGCDDCLSICPWNKFASQTPLAAFQPRADMEKPPLATLLALDDAAFRLFFSKSPVKRIGRVRFIRNCLIAASNSGQTALLPFIETLLEDEAPLVRGMAVYALYRLNRARFETLKTHRNEQDESVLSEWARA
jgi:epoxyqueuosine reductase